MSVKSLARELLPPVITKALRPATKYGPYGDFPSWEDAAAAAAPYKTTFSIVENHREATISGEYDPPCYTGALLAAIIASPKPVNVLDFGGGIALGYYRAMNTVPEKIKSWRVVELPDIVEYSKSLPPDPRLTFHETIEEARADGEPINVVTCSGVLSCMREPYTPLREMFSLGADYIHLDRLAVDKQDRYCIFHTVSGDIIAWHIMSQHGFDHVSKNHRLLFKQKLPRHPTAPAASDEFTLLYAKGM